MKVEELFEKGPLGDLPAKDQQVTVVRGGKKMAAKVTRVGTNDFDVEILPPNRPLSFKRVKRNPMGGWRMADDIEHSKVLVATKESLGEDKWSADVDTKKHPPKDLFATGSAEAIAAWAKKSHKDLKSAMSALNFYVNRAGSKLSADRKSVVEKAKEILSKK